MATEVSWQSHSYNDLREWPSLLRKGLVDAKVDFNFANASQCALQGLHGDRPCFLMSHDTPDASIRAYNTSDDLLRFLVAHSGSNPAVPPLAVAMCFKNSPDVCSSPRDPTAVGWLALVDEFFANASTLSIRWIMDGSPSPIGCLADRWRPWVATYVSDRQPDAAFWSNNATLGYDRLQVLDEPLLWVASAASERWGKFVNSSYSLLVWEPSDEETIAQVAALYVSTGVRHEAGFRFAINIDPAQFQVFAASVSGRGLHLAWPGNLTAPLAVPLWTQAASSGGADDSLPMLTVGRCPSPAAPSSWCFSATLLPNTSAAPRLLSSGPGPWAARTPAAAVQDWSPAAAAAVALSPKDAVARLLVVCSADASCVAGLLDPRTLAPEPATSSVTLSTALTPDPSLMSLATAGPGTLLQAVVSSANCTFSLQPWTVGADLAPRPLALAACASLPGVRASDVTSVAIAGSPTRPSCVPLGCADGATACGLVVVTTSPLNQTLGLIWSLLANGSVALGGRAAPLGPALRASVAVAQQGPDASKRGLQFLVTLDGSYCWHTESHNKRPEVAVCDQQPVAVPGVLNYVAGTLDALDALQQTASPCVDELVVGTFDTGANASTVLLPRPFRQGGAPSADPLAMVSPLVLHDQIHGSPSARSVLCDFPALDRAPGSAVAAAWELVGSGWVDVSV